MGRVDSDGSELPEEGLIPRSTMSGVEMREIYER